MNQQINNFDQPPIFKSRLYIIEKTHVINTSFYECVYYLNKEKAYDKCFELARQYKPELEKSITNTYITSIYTFKVIESILNL